MCSLLFKTGLEYFLHHFTTLTILDATHCNKDSRDSLMSPKISESPLYPGTSLALANKSFFIFDLYFKYLEIIGLVDMT